MAVVAVGLLSVRKLWRTLPIATQVYRSFHGPSDQKVVMLHDNPLQIDNIRIFNAAIDGVMPSNMVKGALKVEGNKLLVNDQKFKLNRNVSIIAFGKAVLGMVRATEDLLGEHVVGGIASVPVGMQEALIAANRTDIIPTKDSKVKIYEGAENNIPDERAQRAAMAVYDYAKSLTANDLCIALISGGGSALLPAVTPPITLEDMAEVTTALSRCGATIQQLNTVRKNLDLLKGGGLAATIQPAKVVSLILSDVIGNPLDLIASGPTYRDIGSPQQCLDLFRVLKVEDKIPPSVIHYLKKCAAEQEISEGATSLDFPQLNPTPRNDTSNALNMLVGSNEILVEKAKEEAESMGYLGYILSTSVDGPASVVGEMLADLAAFVCLTMGNKRRRDMQHSLVQEEMALLRKGLSKDTVNELLIVAEQAANQDRALCVLAAGETVVNVTGTGKGGRNQHLALSAAVHLYENASKYDLNPRFNIQLLSAGTDGQDGPTDATGAMVDSFTYLVGLDKGYDASDYLENNDAYGYFSEVNGGRNLLKTGLTGTNVMDLQVLLIKPTPRNSMRDF